MELLKHRFFEEVFGANQDPMKLTPTLDYEVDDKPIVFHHYLKKGQPQRKIMFYEMDQLYGDIVEEHKLVAEVQETSPTSPFQEHKSKLIQEPIEELMKRLEERKEQQIIQEVSSLANNELSHMEIDKDQGTSSAYQKIKVSSDMWVDKYTSLKFFDLLTDESTNRNVLTWLKSWDDLVFPSMPKVRSLSKAPNWPIKYNQPFAPLNNNFQALSYVQIYSHHNKKVLLIHGPPGSGKSTMARVLARHCGYKPLEINASDERTGEKILKRIENALQMNTISSANPGKLNEPVCLIVDEADGAIGSGTYQESSKGIQMIVDFLKKRISGNAKLRKKEDEDEDQEEEKKRREDIQDIRRPIIFICNDSYAKAIRPLKEIALQVKVKDSNPDRLIKRLRHICREERIQIEDSILKGICKESNYDARSSINSLQFIASVQREVDQVDVKKISQLVADNGSTFGKDFFDNIFNTAEFFMFEKPTLSSKSKELAFVREKFQTFGDSQLLNDCLFENYNKNVIYSDDDLEKTAYFTDMLSAADLQEQFIHKTQNYELKKLQHMPSYMFKLYCSNQSDRLIDFPRIFREMYFAKKENQGIFDQLLDLKKLKVQSKGIKKVKKGENLDEEERYKLESNTSLQCGMTKRGFYLELLPFINFLMHPNIRDINTQLFTAHEQACFQLAIEVMVLFDIQMLEQQVENPLEQEKQYLYEPNIEKLVSFGSFKKENLRAKTKVLILQNYEQIKQQMLTKNLVPSKKKSFEAKSKAQGFGFLGSVVQQHTKKRKRAEMSGGDTGGRVVYKFKEGHSKNFKRILDFDYFL